MLQIQTQNPHRPAQSLRISLAHDSNAIEEAQRLRYRVFTGETGAHTCGGNSNTDRDLFDAHCDHLLVRDTDTGKVVGTCRILSGEAARRIGGFYATMNST